MEFTTEKRREMTSNVLAVNETIENTIKFNNNISASFGEKIKIDSTNRKMFLTLNSELTGLAYEYAYISGKYHPQLEEQKYFYISANDNMTEFETKEYWDAPKLQKAANLEEGNEFHIDLNDGSTAKFPEHPLKYSRWVSDDHTEVSIFSPTEQELFQAIKDLIQWDINGGLSGTTEVTLYSEYEKYIPDSISKYMTVGYDEYLNGQTGFMDDGYDPTGDFILINKTDENNFAFGKIIGSKTNPSRILFSEFCIEGEIPKNSLITSTYEADNPINKKIIYSLIDKLENVYNNINRYLENNPNKSTENVSTKENIEYCLTLIQSWKETDKSLIQELVDELEVERTSIFINRMNYINNYLSSSQELYNDRFSVIDMRLKKMDGTLREAMKISKGISMINEINNDKKNEVSWLGKYFTIKACEQDGDWKRRVFIKDEENLFQEGDEVYILTDNPNIPEIKAIIDLIVPARLKDITTMEYNESTGEVKMDYYSCKKIFFKDAWLNNKMKLKRFFPDTYKKNEGFRIIKQI